MKKTPKLRFKGFEGEWEEKKLEEIAKINPKCELPNTFEYVDLESVVGTIMRSHRTEHKESAPSRAQRLAQQGDIFYQMVRPYQRNNYLFNEDCTNYVFSSGYAQIRPSIDFGFLFTKLQSDSFLQQVLLNCVGTSFPAINPSSLSKLEVCYPTDKTEQHLIASYFTHLDTLIEASRKKVEKYKQVKAASLQALFPQHGECVPKLRFKGCEGEWKKVELGEILLINSGRDYKHLKEGDIPVYGTGGYMLSVNKSLSSVDAIGIGRKGTIDKPQYLAAPFWTVDTLFYLTAKRKDNLRFLYALVQNIDWKRCDESTGVPSLSKSNIETITLQVPPLSEQHLIAQYFTNLDSLLTLEQLRYEKLQQVKRASLSQMFA